MRPMEPRRCFMVCIYCAMEAIIDGPVLYTQSRPAFQSAQNVSGRQSVRKDIEGVFGILKQRFHFLKQFNRMHSHKEIDNSFVTCCILHNMLLKENGYLEPELELLPSGLTKVLRKMFAKVALDGL
jgi:hypothetical protein